MSYAVPFICLPFECQTFCRSHYVNNEFTQNRSVYGKTNSKDFEEILNYCNTVFSEFCTNNGVEN